MMNEKTIVILHQFVPDDAPQDEKDVLSEVAYVASTLRNLGYEPVPVAVSFAIDRMIASLNEIKPAIVFNLVETLQGTGKLCYMPLMVLDYLKLKYSGGHTDAMYQTTNKILAKTLLQYHHIPTPSWQSVDDAAANGLRLEFPVIVKPIWEDASVGITDDSICRDHAAFNRRVSTIAKENLALYVAEQFIAGREVNVALLADAGGPQVLPPAEILFNDYPEGKPAIVNYNAKWEEDSFEYNHTPRTFAFNSSDTGMLNRAKEFARSCWDIFGLCGYARVDMRIDAANNPWVLEVNSNPCISPECGFITAANEAGLSIEQVVRRIVDDAR